MAESEEGVEPDAFAVYLALATLESWPEADLDALVSDLEHLEPCVQINPPDSQHSVIISVDVTAPDPVEAARTAYRQVLDALGRNGLSGSLFEVTVFSDQASWELDTSQVLGAHPL